MCYMQFIHRTLEFVVRYNFTQTGKYRTLEFAIRYNFTQIGKYRTLEFVVRYNFTQTGKYKTLATTLYRLVSQDSRICCQIQLYTDW